MAVKFNKLNAVVDSNRVSLKGVGWYEYSTGNIGAIIVAVALVGVGGCRSMETCCYQPSGSGNDIVSQECSVHVIDASENDGAEVQAYSKFIRDRDMTSGELLKESMEQLEIQNFEKAIVVLYLYLDEIATVGPRLTGIQQDVRFKLASLLIAETRMSEAAKVLKEYINSPLADHLSEAQDMLYNCTLEIEGRL